MELFTVITTSARPKRVKAIDPHRDGPKPRSDLAPVAVIEMTARVVSHEDGQGVRTIDAKFGLIKRVKVGERVEKRRHRNSSCSG